MTKLFSMKTLAFAGAAAFALTLAAAPKGYIIVWLKGKKKEGRYSSYKIYFIIKKEVMNTN